MMNKRNSQEYQSFLDKIKNPKVLSNEDLGRIAGLVYRKWAIGRALQTNNGDESEEMISLLRHIRSRAMVIEKLEAELELAKGKGR